MEKELVRSKEARKITIIGFIVNTFLTIAKFFAGIIGKSSAMIADAVHSLSDFFTDIIVFVGFKFTEKPEDECHNYGHEKYETLATFIISVVLAIAGYQLLRVGIINVITVIKGGTLEKPGNIALIAALVSIALNEILFRYTIHAGKKIESSAVVANAWHHRSDSFSSIGTALGIAGAIFLGNKWTILDPIASIIVSLFIFKVAYDILIPSINELVEKALPKRLTRKIEDIIDKHPDVKDFHELRTRKLGTKAVVECHILVERNLNVKEAHDIATEIEDSIKNILGEDSIVTLHIEPYE